MPKVSAIICVYNQPLVKEAIESVLCQTYPDYELIIIDDGSNDETKDILKRYSSKARIIHLEQNQGIANARNKGLIYANSELIAFLDADDIWLERYLEEMVNFFLAHPSCLLAFSDGWVFKRKEIPQNLDTYPSFYSLYPAPAGKRCLETFFATPIVTSFTMFKRKFFEKVGFFSPEMKIHEDAELIMRGLEQDIYPCFYPKPLAVKRNIKGGLSQNAFDYLYYSRLMLKKSYHRSGKLRRWIRKSIAQANRYLARAYYWKGEYQKARQVLIEVFRYNPLSIRTVLPALWLSLPKPFSSWLIKKTFLAQKELWPKSTKYQQNGKKTARKNNSKNAKPHAQTENWN